MHPSKPALLFSLLAQGYVTQALPYSSGSLNLRDNSVFPAPVPEEHHSLDRRWSPHKWAQLAVPLVLSSMALREMYPNMDQLINKVIIQIQKQHPNEPDAKEITTADKAEIEAALKKALGGPSAA